MKESCGRTRNQGIHAVTEPHRQPIAKVDTAWLRMEQPTNLMMITGVIVLRESVDFETLKEVVASRFLAFPRFRHKAVQTTRGCWWEEDEDFELTSHIRRIALPGDAGKEELEEFVSELASTPLDKYRPLWQFHFIENYAAGPALVTRIHHCRPRGVVFDEVELPQRPILVQRGRCQLGYEFFQLFLAGVARQCNSPNMGGELEVLVLFPPAAACGLNGLVAEAGKGQKSGCNHLLERFEVNR